MKKESEIILSGRSCRVAKCSSPGRRGKTRLFEPRHPSKGATSPPLSVLPPDRKGREQAPRQLRPNPVAAKGSSQADDSGKLARGPRHSKIWDPPADLLVRRRAAPDEQRVRHECAAPRSRGLQGQVRVIRNSIMILPQVHLRKPCYDFYFL